MTHDNRTSNPLHSSLAPFNHLPDPFLCCDSGGTILWVNQVAARTLGGWSGEGGPTRLSDVMCCREALNQEWFLGELTTGGFFGEVELRLPGGRTLAASCRSSLLDGGPGCPRRIGLFLRDISPQTERIGRLQNLCFTDELTGLYNRRYLDQTLDVEEDRARRYEADLGIFCLDINDFALVADRVGHRAADRALLMLAGLVRRSLRQVDPFCRIRAATFAGIFLVQSAETAPALLDRLLACTSGLTASSQTAGGDEGEIVLEVSCGCAVGSVHRKGQARLLLEAADQQMLEARRCGGHRYAWCRMPEQFCDS